MKICLVGHLETSGAKVLKKILLSLCLLIAVVQSASAGPFAWVMLTYDLTDTSYTYCEQIDSTLTCGTAITNGWISIPPNRPVTTAVEWITKNATSLDYQVECRPWNGGLGQAVLTDTLSAVGAEYLVILSNANGLDQCRVGLKLTTDTGDNSVTAYFATR